MKLPRRWFRLGLVIVNLSLSVAITPPEDCFPIADVVFLVDGSDSISDNEFQDQKTFIRRFVETTDIGADKIRVGYVVVSSKIGATLDLSGGKKADILAKVDNITQPQEGSRTDVGLMYVDNMFFTQGRLGTMYIAVMLTDGRTKYQRAAEAEAAVAKNSGIFIISIGVGRHIQDDLLARVATTSSNAYHIKPMNSSLTLLKETVKYLGKEWCSDIVSGLPPGRHTSKSQTKVQKSLYIGTDPSFNSKNFTKLISLLSNKLKENGNISDFNMSFASTSWKSIFLKRLNNSEHVYKMIRASTPLPQTTVFPVTRKNIGQILKTLITSKKAKAQGLAFVKNKKDLRDALKILLASRVISLKRLMPRGNILSMTKAKQNDNASSTPTSVLEILTTTIPNNAHLTDTHLQAKSNIKVTIPTKSDPLKDSQTHSKSKFILHSLNTNRQNKKTKKVLEQPPTSIQKMMSRSRYLTNGKLNSGSKHLQSFKRRKLPSEPIELYNANVLPSKKYSNVLKPNKTPGLLNLKDEMLLDGNKNTDKSTKPDLKTPPETAINISPNKPTKYTVLTAETQPKIVGTSIEQVISKPKPKSTQTVVPNLSSSLAALIKLRLSSKLKPNTSVGQSSGPSSSKTVGKRLGGFGDNLKKPAEEAEKSQLEIPKIKASPETKTYVRPNVSTIKEQLNAKPFENMQKSDFQISVSSEYTPILTLPKMVQTAESKLSSGLAELIKRRLSSLASKSTPNKIAGHSIKSAASKTNIGQSKESATRKPSYHSIEALKQLTAVKKSSYVRPSKQKQQLEIPTINTLSDTKAYVKAAYVKGQLNAKPYDKLQGSDLKLSISSKNRPVISLSKATQTIKSEPSLAKLRSYKLTSMFQPKGRAFPFNQLMQFLSSKTVQTPFQGNGTLKQPPVMPEMYTHHQSKQTQLEIPTINTLSDTKTDRKLKVSFRKGQLSIKPYEKVPKVDLKLSISEKNKPDISVPMANQNVEPNISSDDLAALIKLRLANMASQSKHNKHGSSDSQPIKSATSNTVQNTFQSSIDTLTQSDIMQAEYNWHQTKQQQLTVPTSNVYKKTDVQPKKAYVKSKFSVKPLERMQEYGSKLSVSAQNIPMSNKYTQAKQKHTAPGKESPNRQTGYGIADVRNQNKERIRLKETVAVKKPTGVYNQKAISVVSDTGRVSFSDLKNTKSVPIKPYRKKHTEDIISTSTSIRSNKKQKDMKTVPSSRIMLKTSHKTQMSYKHKSGPKESPFQKELNNNKILNKQWYVKKPVRYDRNPKNKRQPASSVFNGSNKNILNSKLKTTSIVKQHKNSIEFPPEYKTHTEITTSSNGYSSDNGHHQTIQSEAMFPYSLPQSTPRPFDAKLDVGYDRQSTNSTEMPSAQQTRQITVLDKSTALELCASSRYVNGIGYVPKPGSCTDFIQCFHDDGHIKLEVEQCPIGSHFDERFIMCRPSYREMCISDPCSLGKVDMYGHPSNCRAYWACKEGRSEPGCCPVGFSYGLDGTCVMNPNCTSPCLEETPLCNLRPFITNDRFYFEFFTGFGWMIQTCPTGTRYKPDQCKCDVWDEKEVSVECSPQVSLDFEGSQLSGNKTVSNKNVKIGGGVGKFGGQSMITLWRFTGVSFGRSVLITLRFKVPETERTNGTLMHLLSNCCIGCPGRPGPTIDIAVLTDTTGGVIVLSTYSSASGEKFIFIPYSNTVPDSERNNGTLMHLLSNCCIGCPGRPGPTIDIAVLTDTRGGGIVLSTFSSASGEKFIFIPYSNTKSGWNSLMYSYDGEWLVGTVNGITARQQMKGTIESRPYPLLLGSCGTVPSFKGFIDDNAVKILKFSSRYIFANPDLEMFNAELMVAWNKGVSCYNRTPKAKNQGHLYKKFIPKTPSPENCRLLEHKRLYQ